MSNVKTTFFYLLRCALNSEAPKKEDIGELSPEEAEKLYKMSKVFDFAHITGYELGLAGLLSAESELGQKYSKRQIEALWRCEQLDYETLRIGEALEALGIDHIFLKGAVIRPLYPEKWMRTSADIDLLVREEDFDRSVSGLCERLGYTVGETCDHHTELVFPTGFKAEVHPTLVETNQKTKKILGTLWETASRIEGREHEYAMSPEMFYFYMIAHMEKHFRNGGCGIRPFADLWVLERKFPFDRAKGDALLKDGGILTFERKSRQLVDYWFAGAPADELCLKMEAFILGGNAYGSMKNRVALQQVKQGGKGKYAMNRLFMSYDQLIELYPSLEGHKWLTPFYQIRRWFYHAFGGRFKRSVKELWYNQSRSSDEIDETEDMFDRLGLL